MSGFLKQLAGSLTWLHPGVFENYPETTILYSVNFSIFTHSKSKLYENAHHSHRCYRRLFYLSCHCGMVLQQANPDLYSWINHRGARPLFFHHPTIQCMQVTIAPHILGAMKNWISQLDKAIAARHLQWIRECLDQDIAHPEWVWTEADVDTYNEYNVFNERAQNILNGKR